MDNITLIIPFCEKMLYYPSKHFASKENPTVWFLSWFEVLINLDS